MTLMLPDADAFDRVVIERDGARAYIHSPPGVAGAGAIRFTDIPWNASDLVIVGVWIVGPGCLVIDSHDTRLRNIELAGGITVAIFGRSEVPMARPSGRTFITNCRLRSVTVIDLAGASICNSLIEDQVGTRAAGTNLYLEARG